MKHRSQKLIKPSGISQLFYGNTSNFRFGKPCHPELRKRVEQLENYVENWMDEVTNLRKRLETEKIEKLQNSVKELDQEQA